MQGRDFSAELFDAPASQKPVGKDFSAELFGAPVRQEIAGRDLSAELFDTTAPQPKPAEEFSPFLRQVADVPLHVASGVVQGVRMIADAFGADTSVGQNLRGVEGWIADLYSAQAKKDSKKVAQIMKEAEDQGVVANLVAAAKAFQEAPVDLISNALGTAAPAILTGVVTTLTGGTPLVTSAAMLGTGAVMGAGTTKGAIYDATKQILSEQTKMSPKQIEKAAVDAQAYGGKNLDQILLGAGLGAIGAETGAEAVIARQLAKRIASTAATKEAGKAAMQEAVKQATLKETERAAERGLLKHGAITGGKEFIGESLQGGQEQLAQNLAQQRLGFDVPTMRGVVGQGALEGLAGLGMGVPGGAIESAAAKRELAEAKAVEDLKTRTKEEADRYYQNVMLTSGMDQTKAMPTATAEDIDMLMPARNEQGEPLTTASESTVVAKQQADEQAATEAAAEEKKVATATATAQTLIDQSDAGKPVKKDDINAAAKELGVKFDFHTDRSNKAKIERLREHIAGQGQPSVSGTQQPAGGTSAPVAAQPQPTAGQPAGTDRTGMAPAGAAAPATDVGKTAQPSALTPEAPAAKSKAQQDEDYLNDLLGGSDLAARRTNAQIAVDEQLGDLGKRYGLTRGADETPQAFGSRIKNAIAFEKKREAQEAEGIPALAEMTDQELAAQELKGERTYQPDKEQIEAYEENRQYYNENLDEDEAPLPAYKELSPEDRIVYFQNNIPLGTRGTAAQHRAALRQLADFREGVKEEVEPYQVRDRDTGELLFNEDGTPLMTRAPLPGETRGRSIYNEAKDEFSRKGGLSYAFPAWVKLSTDSKRLFLDINKTNTALERDMAFRAVRKQIQKELAEQAARERSEDEKSWATSQVEQAMEEAKNAGKGDKLPIHVVSSLLKGDIKAVLDYISENGNGARLKIVPEFVLSKIIKNKAGREQPIFKKGKIKIRDSISAGVFRALASTLGGIDNLKINVVYDPHMVYGNLARYDANTNTIFVGPNGFDESTILHEITHAATVKIIHQFFTDASKLSPRAKFAVEHLVNVASAAQKRLGSRYPNAFENLYEFIAYAMTDPDFQLELAGIQIKSLATVTAQGDEQNRLIQEERETAKGASRYDYFMDTLWNYYTGTLAYMYRLFTPHAKTSEHLLYTSETGFVGRRTKAEIKRGEKLERAARETRATRAAAAERYDQKIAALEEREREAVPTLFDDPEEEMDEASIPPAPQDYVTVDGVKGLQRTILREPGYKGNLLLEAAEMVQLILEAPEGGIEQLAGKGSIGTDLFSKQASVPESKTREGGLQDEKLRESYKLGDREKLESNKERFWHRITTTKGWLRTAKDFIDRTYAARYRERQLDMAGLINRDPTGAFNNFSEQGDLATGEGRNFLIQMLHQPMEGLKQSIAALAKLTKQDINKDVLPTLHMLAEAFGEPEKRHMKWLLSVPLDKDNKKITLNNGKQVTPAQRRIDLMGDPRTGKPGLIHRIALDEAQQKQIRAELEYLAKNHADPLGDSPRIKSDKIRERLLNQRQKKNQLGIMSIDENSDTYNVLGINKDEVKLRMDQFRQMPAVQRAAIEEIMDNIRQITKATAELNKIGNYWSYPVSNIVGIYNYQNYMPFKGLSKHSVVDEMIDPDGSATKTSRILQQEEHAAHGRFSVSDNPILQTMSDAFRAAGRAGRRNFMQAILNAVKPDKKKNPNGTGVIDGEVVERVEFADRDVTDLTKYQGQSYIFVYSPDGSISIVKINDKDVLQALRYQYQQNGFFVDLANQVTNFFGSMHTRWNINFATKNFVSDTLQNAWNIGAGKLGPLKAATYLGEISTAVAKNGLGKAMEVAMLYEKGDPASNRILAEMVNNDPFVRDMVEMLKIGGKTSYLMSFSLRNSLQQLEKEVGRNGIVKTLDGANKVADIWNSMFEFTSRAAAYQVFKREFLKEEIEKGVSNDRNGKEMSPAEQAAAWRAAAATKNLTNFEVVGERSKYLTALYMFFKASAVSAARTVEATMPAFRSVGAAEANLPANVRENPVALDKWRQEYAQLQRNARIMVGSLIGFGYGMYALSMLTAPDDEWKRNKTRYDNMDQWTRYARFHLPESISKALGMGKDVVFQIPWGFGLGSFASAGAQIGGMMHGQTSFRDGMSNILAGSLADAFLPLPISKIPFSEKPGMAAFDTIMPSVLRPYSEYLTNTDGVGRGINSAMNRRMGDAFTGSDRVPQIYKDAATYVFLATEGALDWSPNSMYFFTNSYIDGIARLGEMAYSWADLTEGKKDFNPKTDLPLFGSFFGTKTNVDAREYGEMESRIRELDKRLHTLDEVSPEKAFEYDSKNPFDRAIIDIYKKRQGELDKLRKEANELRWDRTMSPKNRDALIKIIILEENLIKHEMVEDFKAYGMKP